jgi:hypothetical protein
MNPSKKVSNPATMHVDVTTLVDIYQEKVNELSSENIMLKAQVQVLLREKAESKATEQNKKE